MKLAIFGANGQTGRLAIAVALNAGHQVLAVTRRAREFPLAGPELTVAEGPTCVMRLQSSRWYPGSTRWCRRSGSRSPASRSTDQTTRTHRTRTDTSKLVRVTLCSKGVSVLMSDPGVPSQRIFAFLSLSAPADHSSH